MWILILTVIARASCAGCLNKEKIVSWLYQHVLQQVNGSSH
jgi:hypothetical protein